MLLEVGLPVVEVVRVTWVLEEAVGLPEVVGLSDVVVT